MSLKTQINKGETNILEFKETFRYDVKNENTNKSLKNEVSKAVCGMLNSGGGKVLIGVADNKTIEGIQRDLNLYGKVDERFK
jgi:predicted HTH transcriptional regulator